jgi:hypothetical protein
MPRTYTKYFISDYEITREGNVINKHTGRMLKLQPNGKGYLRFAVQTENGKRFVFVHRLVAQIYVPNPDGKPQVNHIDGDKTNNNADNLEWVTNADNRRHAVDTGLHIHGERCPWAKLQREDVQYIRAHPEMTRKELAEKYGVDPHTISDIRTGRSWNID